MKKIGENIFRLFIACCLMLSYTPLMMSQTTTTGAIQGLVQEIGANQGIPGAVVTVLNQVTGLKRTTVSRDDGTYWIATLPPGWYTISATCDGYQPGPNSTEINFGIKLSKTNTVQPPPITLQRVGTTTPTTQPTQQASTPSGIPASESEAEQLVNTTNATRGGNFDRRSVVSLPLPGVRTFDDLAFLVAGVAPPPQAIGSTVGPGIGPGVGTSGQFSVNGLRSRSNNFTIDGSDNNDEDIGVRRQGFTSLVPQSIESVQEFQIDALLFEPQFGRNMGAQVNAVSRSGGTGYHGTAYGFFTDRRLKARDVFDLKGGPSNFPIVRSDGAPVLVGGQPLAPSNPVGEENPFTRAQYGFVLGGPLVEQKTHFFFSFEHQDLNASRESHFAVPTVAERGLFGTGDRGLLNQAGAPITPTSVNGDAFFSLFPFPNNPFGPYGFNTYTEVIPANADGTIFSIKLDQLDLNAFGAEHTLSGRYNFTDDDTILPVTGEALFSTLRALVQTQNLAITLNSAISSRVANQARFSYGRTELDFEEVRNSFLIPSTLFPNTPFLLNAPLILNATVPGSGPRFLVPGRDTETLGTGFFDPSNGTGPIGQVKISGFSPIGVDVFNFPQGRINNTFQFADTLLYDRGKHRFSAGFDIRRTHLDSFLDRNFRPLAIFSAAADISPQVITQQLGSDVPGFFLGRDYAALGTPGGFYQTLSFLVPDSNIRLRYWQNDFFLVDQIRARPNFTVTLGIRYELNTVPTEKDRRIESSFAQPEVQNFINIERQFFGVSGLEQFLAGRTKIYERDNNNIAPHIAFAWDPHGDGKMSVRAGYGIYYDQILGAVVSQSRNVFPNFFTVNTAGVVSGGRSAGYTNPASLAVPGTLNNSAINNPAQFLTNLARNSNSAAGPGFVLPVADLVTPYSQHWSLTLEREIERDFLVSAAYVGTKGVHLLRFATPNLGVNAIPGINAIFGRTSSNLKPGISPDADRNPGNANVAPGFRNGGRPFPLLGSFTSIESDANSIYHALQLQANKRFSHGIQFTTAYTWSHAIDEVSDVFDLAGARSLPQDNFNFKAERGDANFDVRHRFVYSLVWDVPVFEGNNILGGWQVSSIGTFQTGQPYTVRFCCDVNLDGNLTDRPGIAIGGLDSGRNAFRAPGLATVDLAVNKGFRLGERQNIEFRSEFFNLFNRSHFGIPVNQLFFGGFTVKPLSEKNFVDTILSSRTIQFALKYNF